MTQRWYVVQSKSNLEQFAASELMKQRFETFVPLCAFKSKVKGKAVDRVRALFPSYFFVAFDIEATPWKRILGTRGVVKLLSATEDSATPLPIGFAEDMIAKAGLTGLIALPEAEKVIQNYAKGTRLEIVDGIFQGLSGTCEECSGNNVTLFLALLSGNARVKIKNHLVTPLTGVGGSVAS